MSNILQIIERKGHLCDPVTPIPVPFPVPAGRTVRIDPMLFAPSSKISDCVYGDPDFSGNDSPPLAPTSVNLSSGFQLESINTNRNSAFFGCFYAQNVTDHAQELWWQAICDLSLQQNIRNTSTQSPQTTVGPAGYSGGSPTLNPAALQGTAPRDVTTGDTGTPAVKTLLIEEVNNQIINISGTVTTVNLPSMGSAQNGMEVTFKNMYPALGARPTLVAAAGQTIERGVFWQFPPPTAPGPVGVGLYYAITLVFLGTNWFIKSHYHQNVPLEPIP